MIKEYALLVLFLERVILNPNHFSSQLTLWPVSSYTSRAKGLGNSSLPRGLLRQGSTRCTAPKGTYLGNAVVTRYYWQRQRCGQAGKGPTTSEATDLRKTTPARPKSPGGGQASGRAGRPARGPDTARGHRPAKGAVAKAGFAAPEPPPRAPPARCRQHRLPKSWGRLPSAPQSRVCGAPRRGQRVGGPRRRRESVPGEAPHGGQRPRPAETRPGAAEPQEPVPPAPGRAGAASQVGRRGAWPGPAGNGGAASAPPLVTIKS